jgi:hypothetical protein
VAAGGVEVNRRSLFKRVGAVAAAVAVGASVEPVQATEQDEVAALVKRVTENPDQYPELMARARELMGTDDGGLYVRGTSEWAGDIVINTHAYNAFMTAPLTPELLCEECRARGCHLDSQYDIERLRYRFVHWRDGETWADDTLTMRSVDLERVANWVGDLHQIDDRRVPLYG